MLFTRNKISCRGFTIVELLTVIFIIALISSAVLVNYQKGQNQYRVNQTAQKLSADFRRVQNLALVGKSQGAVIPKGYGLYSQPNQYIIFYNTQENSSYFPGSTVLETILLENNVVLSPAGITVFFQPPNPLCCIDGSSANPQVFTLTKGDSQKTVTVYPSGRIDVN